MFYSITVKTEPEKEPVTLEEVKRYLRIDNNDEDDVVSDFIVASRHLIEGWANRAFRAQELVWTLTEEPLSAPSWNWFSVPWIQQQQSLFEFPRRPIKAVASVVSIDNTGAVSTVTDYVVEDRLDPPRLRFSSMPAGQQQQIIYTAGYDLVDQPVPPGLILAIKVLVAHLYEHRGDESGVAQPDILDDLLRPYRLPVW